ncbi:MAG TPA: hypothetical protein VK797_21515 [Tepidisphaeraceae bacterium]|jgi:hypothetical protein|nr:hypothetical protein [Tepidisphaeraceae bacterium]
MTCSLTFGIGALALLATMAAAAEPAHSKMLIEFGWDEPGTAFMREHAAQMEATPFDGCVFHADAVDEQGKPLAFTWQCWGKQTFSDAASAVVNNAKLAATFARAGGCAGILFDIEQYNQPLFNYPKQRDAKTRSWSEYAAQARKRGREVMEAFQAADPDVTILLTYGYSLPWRQARSDPARLSSAAYGLLAPFLDGMLDATRGKSRIIDGYESSYGYKDTTRFATAYETMSKGVLPIVADPEKYRQHFQFGFGVWMDNNSHRQKWNPQDFSRNFYMPAAFEKTVKEALDRTDEYVWIYTEEPKWWTAQGHSDKLPDAYVEALKKAAVR